MESILPCTQLYLAGILCTLSYMFRRTCDHLQAINVVQEFELNFCYIYLCLVTEISILHKNLQYGAYVS
jgi:hypothetical protein